jgi:5-methylcytosine-specific restriction endonuclease McrA
MSEYEQYLQSPEWATIRSKVMDRDDNWCQYCGRHEAKEVHHLTYKNRGNEQMEDLISLCIPCHSKQHGIVRKHLLNKKDYEMFNGAFNSYEDMVDAEYKRFMDNPNA